MPDIDPAHVPTLTPLERAIAEALAREFTSEAGREPYAMDERIHHDARVRFIAGDGYPATRMARCAELAVVAARAALGHHDEQPADAPLPPASDEPRELTWADAAQVATEELLRIEAKRTALAERQVAQGDVAERDLPATMLWPSHFDIEPDNRITPVRFVDVIEDDEDQGDDPMTPGRPHSEPSVDEWDDPDERAEQAAITEAMMPLQAESMANRDAAERDGEGS